MHALREIMVQLGSRKDVEDTPDSPRNAAFRRGCGRGRRVERKIGRRQSCPLTELISRHIGAPWACGKKS